MWNSRRNSRAGRGWTKWIAVPSTVLGLGLFAACADVLDVNMPTRVQEESLKNPAMASILVASAIGDFECAYAEFVHATGLWVDEYINSAGWSDTREWSTRAGHVIAGTTSCPTVMQRGNFGVYRPMQTARAQAETALTHIASYPDESVPNKNRLLATAAAYAGYALTLLGEAWCETAIDGGPIMPSTEALKLAEDRFSRAIEYGQAAGASADSVRFMALVGRARIRIDLGKKAEAAADARLVPQNFVRNATYASTPARRVNHIYLNNNANFAISVDPRFRNLAVEGTPDPRVPVANANRNGNDGSTPLWVQTKYASLAAPIPIATWDEAQLIIAEAEGGQDAVDAINRIRTKYNLPPYAGGSAEEIRQQIIEERRRTLFLQGHRLSDHLRFNLPFNTGTDHKGVPYVEQYTCIPLPRAEVIGAP